MQGLSDFGEIGEATKIRRNMRDRANSNDNFSLPPLPSDEDNRDLGSLDFIQSDLGNYSSNNNFEDPHDISAIPQED